MSALYVMNKKNSTNHHIFSYNFILGLINGGILMNKIKITFLGMIFVCQLFLPSSAIAATKSSYYDVYNKLSVDGKWEDCVNIIGQAIKEYPDEINFHNILNYSMRNLKKKEEALQQIIPVYNKYPDNKTVKDNYRWSLHDLGWEKDAKGLKTEALELFKKAYDLDPDDEWNINAYGYELKENGELNKSLELLESGLNKYPKNKSIKNNYGYTLLTIGWDYDKNGKKDEALGMFQKAFDNNPDDEWTMNAYGYGLRENGKIDESIKIYEEAYSKYKDNKYIPGNLLITYIVKANKLKDSKELDKAEPFYIKAGNLNPDDETFLLNYGNFLNKKERFKEAIDIFEKGRKLYPQKTYFQPNIIAIYYDYAKKEESAKNWDNAIEVMSEAMNKFPDEIWFPSYLADYYIQKKDYHNAGEYIIKMAEIKARKKIQQINGFDLELSIYYKTNSVVYKYGSEGRFDEALKLIDRVNNYMVNKYYILQMKGVTLYHSGQKAEGINMVYKAYDAYIPSHPDYKKNVLVNLPLKGMYLVGGNSSKDYITHAGMNRFCFDFMGSDERGNLRKYNSGGLGENKDYIGFGNVVYSPVDGVVENVDDSVEDLRPSWNYRLTDGNFVTIKDDKGFLYILVHIKNKSARVKKGQIVKAGDTVAQLGNSGMTTIPHLHFGVYSPDWAVSIPVKFKEYKVIKGNRKLNNSTPQNGNIITN